MNDLKETIEALMPLLIIAVTLVAGVFFLQLINDPACASLERDFVPAYSKLLSKILFLCWW